MWWGVLDRRDNGRTLPESPAVQESSLCWPEQLLPSYSCFACLRTISLLQSYHLSAKSCNSQGTSAIHSRRHDELRRGEWHGPARACSPAQKANCGSRCRSPRASNPIEQAATRVQTLYICRGRFEGGERFAMLPGQNLPTSVGTGERREQARCCALETCGC